MNELRKLIKDAQLWAYALDNGRTGIVVANSPDEAEQKVRDAYEKHSGYENSMDSVVITICMIEDLPFADAPDVLEVWS